ncbi:2-dehydropantoate 2-reductase [Peribacillus deserti]|uniref:2-dehydropantoate 2-reductase n=1 Tax=Peribacillus deserti TaxID=673318 RepID=A0ABS2QI31_9BACI|nr:2-dehydropantoate 2-reductase [Peribacillus deserti]MBM7692374.1 2-dehydropantoate 2-reductase [Peribacillus deserti]
MKIGIIGGGSIGLLFAAYLSQINEVTLYTRTEKQADIIAEHGVKLLQGDHARIARVSALPIQEIEAHTDLLIVCVKSYHLIEVLPHIKNHYAALLFLQNGMSHLNQLDGLPHHSIGIGIVEHGALKLNDHTVKHTGLGVTRAAAFRGSTSFYDLEAEGNLFPFIIEQDYYGMMLKKLIVNACINPLTAVLGAPNGALMENAHYYSLFQSLLKEIIHIFNIDEKKEMQEYIERICMRTALNKSSMLRDIEEKRLTEIDAILGFVIEQASIRKKEPALAKLLYSMVKGKELQGEERD